MNKYWYLLFLFVGLLAFILHIFVFQTPDGTIGLLLCMGEVAVTVFSTIKLYQLSEKFRRIFKSIAEVLFFWS